MMPYNKMDFVEQCFRVVRDVYVVMALAAPIVDIDSWLKTQKMSKRLEELEERLATRLATMTATPVTTVTTVTKTEAEEVVGWSP